MIDIISVKGSCKLSIEGLHKMIDIVELTISMQFECLFIHITDVFLEDQALDVGLKGFQLEIVLSFVVG